MMMAVMAVIMVAVGTVDMPVVRVVMIVVAIWTVHVRGRSFGGVGHLLVSTLRCELMCRVRLRSTFSVSGAARLGEMRRAFAVGAASIC